MTVEVVETGRGPVIIGGPDTGEEAVSLRHPPRVTGELGFDALPALLRARTVADLDVALDRWVEPVNVVQAADTDGRDCCTGSPDTCPCARTTNRLRIVPAWDAAYAWRTCRAPMARADVHGTAVMANQRGIAAPLGVEFAPPHRADRIRELLDESARWTAKDMAAIHMDTHLASAGPLLELLEEVAELDGPEAVRQRDRLLRWDRQMDADSTDATLYAALRAEVVHRLAAHPALAPLHGSAHSDPYPELFHPWLATVPRIAYALEGLLTGEDGPLTHADRVAVVAGAMERVAAAEVTRPWGELHRLSPWQALPGADSDESRPGLAGDHDCVLSTSSVPGVTDRSARGPAARYVWDLARREDSLWVVPFGASGVPGGAHHRDQLPLWVRGELVPVVTDWNLLHREEERRDVSAETSAGARAESAVYERKVDGFGTVSLVPVDPARDLDVLHAWVTEDRARFWGMGGYSREQVLETYEFLDSLTTHHAYLAYRDGVPVALFQTYEPDADPLGECYDVQPGDLGVHLLIGPDRHRRARSRASPVRCSPYSSTTSSATPPICGSSSSPTPATRRGSPGWSGPASSWARRSTSRRSGPGSRS